MLLFVVGPQTWDGQAHSQAARYVRMSRALSASTRVALACPIDVARSVPEVCAQPYASERQLRALVDDAVVAVTPSDVVSTYPSLARASARLVIDTWNCGVISGAALRSGEFFLCSSERERERWLRRLANVGRLGRVKPRGDVRRLIDVVDPERLEQAPDGDEIERVVDPLRLYYTSSARLPRGWAWNPPSSAVRAWRILRDEGVRTLASRVLTRLHPASRARRTVAAPTESPRVSAPHTAGEVSEARTLHDLHQVLVARQLVGASGRFIDLEIDVSNRCNIRCQMCYFSFDETFHAKPVYMKPDNFEAIAERVLPHAKAVMLSLGSEPLVSPAFTRILEVAARYRVPDLGFYTNGLLMNDRIIEAILAHRVTLVAVSLDGATKATFESIRRGADFDVVLRNVRALTRRRAELRRIFPRIRFGVVMMRRNIEELPDIVTLAWRLGVEELNFFHAVVYEGLDMDSESLVHHKALSNEYLARAQARAHELGVRIVHNPSPFNLEGAPSAAAVPARVGARTDEPYCRFPFFHLSIDSSGRVRPCPFAHGEPPLGVVSPQTPIDAIWLGPAITTLRQRILANDPPPMCRRCSFLASSQPDRPELFDARPN